MNAMQRVVMALGHQEPDRVPLCLLTTLHGAKETGLSIEAYFSRAEHVVEGQLRLLHKYGGDCLYPFFYAALETEAWGSHTLFSSDGPPLCGAPVIGTAEQIDTLRPPRVADAAGLQRMLQAIAGLKAAVGDAVPIVGVVMSPFSLPVMQMGFDHYLALMHGQRSRFWGLMQANTDFCVEWANAQMAAGAAAICYFDPVSSTTIVSRQRYLETGQKVARRTLARIAGPTLTHLASGRGLSIVGDVADTGTAALGVSALEDLAALKQAARGRVALLGNLNGIEMRRWTPAKAEDAVKRAIAQAAPGGGFLLSDNHDEIPWQVPHAVLLAIGQAVRRWGKYPLDWLATEAQHSP